MTSGKTVGELEKQIMEIISPRIVDLYGVPIIIAKTIVEDKTNVLKVLEELWNEYPMMYVLGDCNVENIHSGVRFYFWSELTEEQKKTAKPWRVDAIEAKKWFKKWSGKE